MSNADKIVAPFSHEQVEGLNAYQQLGIFHPYTCGNEEHRNGTIKGNDVLVAHEDGWHCPTCEYRQDWALSFMVNVAQWRREIFGS